MLTVLDLALRYSNPFETKRSCELFQTVLSLELLGGWRICLEYNTGLSNLRAIPPGDLWLCSDKQGKIALH